MNIHPSDKPFVDVLKCNMNDGPWVAGGAVLQWLNGRSVGDHDIDVFIKSESQFNDILNRLEKTFLLKKDTKDSGFDTLVRLEEDTFQVIYTSDNARTIGVRFDVSKPMRKIQLIKKFYDTADDVINNFDIDLCQFVTDGRTVKSTEAARLARRTKTATVIKWHPASIKRIFKYHAYGYKVSHNLNEIESRPEFFITDYLSHCDYEDHA